MFSVYLENVNVWCAMLTLDLYYLGIIYSVVVRYLIKHTALNKKKKKHNDKHIPFKEPFETFLYPQIKSRRHRIS